MDNVWIEKLAVPRYKGVVFALLPYHRCAGLRPMGAMLRGRRCIPRPSGEEKLGTRVDTSAANAYGMSEKLTGG